MIKIKKSELVHSVRMMDRFERGGDVTFFVENNQLFIKADNNAMWLSSYLPAEGDIEGLHRMEIPSKKLMSIIDSLAGDEFTIKAVANNGIRIVGADGDVEHYTGVAYAGAIPSHPAIRSDGPTFKVESHAELAHALMCANKFVDHNEMQFDKLGLSGPAFGLATAGKNKFVKVIGTTRTNGVAIAIKAGFVAKEGYLGMIHGPASSAFEELAKQGGTELWFGDNLAQMEFDGTTIICSKPNSNLPELIDKVINSRKNPTVSMSINSNEFYEKLGAATSIPVDYYKNEVRCVYWYMSPSRCEFMSRGACGNSRVKVKFDNWKSAKDEYEIIFDPDKTKKSKIVFPKSCVLDVIVTDRILFLMNGSKIYYQCLMTGSNN